MDQYAILAGLGGYLVMALIMACICRAIMKSCGGNPGLGFAMGFLGVFGLIVTVCIASTMKSASIQNQNGQFRANPSPYQPWKCLCGTDNRYDRQFCAKCGRPKAATVQYTAQKTGSTISPPEEISQSLFSILIDASTGEIVAERDAYDRMYPASMTKVMTLLVAVEHLHTLDDKIIVSQEAADYSYSHGGSAVNWSPGEEITVKDLLYGCILSSGADACYDLAVYVAGDLDSFVELMNEKVEELGLSATTHFTNVAGFYDDNHYTTAYDMAMILKAAVENDLCREVMSAHTYTTPSTEEHPEGILISNWFLRRIEDKDSKGLVLCAKTGFVNQSGNCAASYMISNSGRPYLCVTGHAHSAWRAIYDHVGLYYNYTK